MHRSATRAYALPLLLLITLAAVAPSAGAAAGKLLFVAGDVTIERSGSRAARVGDAVEVGDVIVTGERARAQLLMGDGARIALRAGTRFRIDAFTLPANVQNPGTATAVAASGRSAATLLKGGFRTRTGAIGKAAPETYEVRTPVGTLGIRGTDYTAVFCNQDCSDAPGMPPGQPVAPGLYLAVDEGAIVFDGRGLAFDLEAGETAFVPLEQARHEELREPPAFLREDGQGPLTVGGARAKPRASETSMLGRAEREAPSGAALLTLEAAPPPSESELPGVERPVDARTPLGRLIDLTDPQLPPAARNALAAAIPGVGGAGAFATSAAPLVSTTSLDGSGSLIQFDAPASGAPGAPLARYGLGTASVTNAGAHAASGIRWSRWTAGSAVTSGGAVDLALASLHTILGPAYELEPVLPISGTASFVLVGGTDPTDTRGNVGVLGGGYLLADFTNGSVTATIAAQIAGASWYATGTGQIAAGAPLFAGNFGTVLVDGLVPGSGSFAGFFAADPVDPTQLTGAGLTYSLAESTSQLGTISGTAAFAPGVGQPPAAPPPPRRGVAYAAGQLGASARDGAALDALPDIVLDGGGNLLRFLAPFGARGNVTSATYAIGSATTADAGIDAATGLRWGRWTAGQASVTPAGGTTQNLDLAQQSLHWIVGSAFGTGAALPVSGTADYVLVGATSPTDTAGNVGALGGVRLAADFTNRTVTSAVRLTIDGRSWYGSGSGAIAAASFEFAGALAGEIQGLAPASGSFSGFFSPASFGGASQSGAGLSYTLEDPQGGLGPVSGVAALRAGAPGAPLLPAPRDRRDIGFVIADLGQGFFESANVLENDPSEYALDADFNLTRFRGFYSGQPADFSVPATSLTDTGYDTIAMLRWGRWSGGTLTIAGPQTATISLAQQSLHFIESADRANPPVIPISGTARYVLAGGTSPTDNQGRVGILGSATFDADFTLQEVTHALSIDMGAYTVSADGIAPLVVGQNGLPMHLFGGDYTNVLFDYGTGPQPASGGFTGFFTGPAGGPIGAPAGAGLTYALTDGQSGIAVNGAVGFQRQ